MDQRAGTTRLPIDGVTLRIVAAAAAGLTLAACGSAGPRSPLGTASSSGIPSSSGSQGPGTGAWEVLGGGPLPDPGAFMTGIAVRGDLVVAVGGLNNDDGSPRAGIWISKGGGGWTWPVTEGASSGFPRAIAVNDHGFVVVGWDGCPDVGAWAYGDTSECSTAVWVSVDGSRWQRLEQPAIPATILTAVTSWDGGMLAVGVTNIRTESGHAGPTGGSQSTPGQVEHPGPTGIVLRSRDSRTWEQVDVGSTLGGAVVTDVVADDDGLVAAGVHLRLDGSFDYMQAWVSLDGQTWAAQPMAGEAWAFWVSLAPGPSGVVASGLNPGLLGGPPQTPSWRRTSGGGWVGLGLSAGWETRLFASVAGGSDGALIAGGDSDSGAAVLYASADGEHWMLIPVDGALAATPITSLAATWAGGRFYLAGATPASAGASVYVMVGSPHMPTAAEVAAAPPDPTPTPEPQQLYAKGTAGLELSGVDGYVAHPAGAAHCTSVLGGTALDYVGWTDAGSLRGARMYGFLSLPRGARVGDSVELRAFLRADAADEEFPQWIGTATIADLGPDGTYGRLTFTAIPQTPVEGTNQPRPDGPASITGSLTWQCGPWSTADPDASAGASVAP
jgi:hypothetical protein